MTRTLSPADFYVFDLKARVQLTLEHLESKVKEVAHALSNEGTRLDHLSVVTAMAILRHRLKDEVTRSLLASPNNEPEKADLWTTIRDLIGELRTDIELQHDEAKGTRKIFQVLEVCERLDSLQEKYMVQERNRTPQIPPILLTGETR